MSRPKAGLSQGGANDRASADRCADRPTRRRRLVRRALPYPRGVRAKPARAGHCRVRQRLSGGRPVLRAVGLRAMDHLGAALCGRGVARRTPVRPQAHRARLAAACRRPVGDRRFCARDRSVRPPAPRDLPLGRTSAALSARPKLGVHARPCVERPELVDLDRACGISPVSAGGSGTGTRNAAERWPAGRVRGGGNHRDRSGARLVFHGARCRAARRRHCAARACPLLGAVRMRRPDGDPVASQPHRRAHRRSGCAVFRHLVGRRRARDAGGAADVRCARAVRRSNLEWMAQPAGVAAVGLPR